MGRRLLTFSFFLLLGNPLLARQFEFNAQCSLAYNHLISLKLTQGEALINQEKTANPGNLIPVLLENYLDFLTLFTREEPGLYNQLKNNKDLRLASLKKGDKNSPWYLYSQAEIYLQWAFTRVRFEEYLSALLEIRKAYKLLQENQARFPTFLPNLKTLGLLHCLLSTIPDQYKWGLNLMGLEGNLQKGVNQLKTVLEKGDSDPDFPFLIETIILRASILLLVEKKGEDALSLMELYKFPLSENLMTVYTAANVAIYAGKTDLAITILENRPKGNSFAPYPYLDFLLGLAKLNRNDPNAGTFIQKFLENYQGRNQVKHAWQKLGWHHLIHGNPEQYAFCMKKVLANGYTTVDADKQAQKEAESGVVPSVPLLKARVLSDGGYFEKAYSVIQPMSEKDFLEPKQQLEFLYRKARIYDEWGKKNLAIPLYETTINRGADLPYYFAANASLHLGFIYEEAGKFSKAREAYKKCLTFSGHEYKNSIDQKAKAALARIEGK